MLDTPYTQADFTVSPLMFYYEVTQACDLVCKHCRASSQETAAADELLPELSLRLIEQVATFPRKPNLCFTGGDPLKRADLFVMIRHAVDLGITTALTPSATPLATSQKLEAAAAAGVSALGISLDGPCAEVHDAFRGFAGSFDKTLEMLAIARHLGLPVQVNTSVTRRNVLYMDAIAELLATQGIRMWSVFFLVPVGRGHEEARILPAEYLTVFEKLWRYSQTMPFAIKTTEAPHYRRFVLEKGGDPLHSVNEDKLAAGNVATRSDRFSMLSVKTGHFDGVPSPFPAAMKTHNSTPLGAGRRAPLGVTDGRGIMFVSQNGQIFPAGFLPMVCGQFPNDSVVDVYQNHPLFKDLQNPDTYKGICGRCSYRMVCGGSRARAFAITGDPLAAEPDCVFEV